MSTFNQPTDAGKFNVILLEDNTLELVSEDGSCRIDIAEGSVTDARMRRKLIENKVLTPITILFPPQPEYTVVNGRKIATELLKNTSPVATLVDPLIEHSSRSPLPTYDYLLYWAESNDVDEQIMTVIKNSRNEILNNHYGTADDKEMIRFIKLLMWGGTDFVSSAKSVSEIHRMQNNPMLPVGANALIKTEWRREAIVDTTDLVYLKTVYHNAFNWKQIKVNELAMLVAFNRDFFFHEEGSYNTNKELIRKRLSLRAKRVAKFRAAIEPNSAALWYGTLYQLSMQGYPKLIPLKSANSDAPIWDHIAIVAKHFTLEESLPFITQGLFDVQQIKVAIDHDIDFELLNSL